MNKFAFEVGSELWMDLIEKGSMPLRLLIDITLTNKRGMMALPFGRERQLESDDYLASEEQL